MFCKWKKILNYKSLIWMMTTREIKSRYRGTVLGFLWSFINPVLLMIVYILIFSVYIRLKVENYTIFLFCGLLPWIWFSSVFNASTRYINDNASIIKKVYIPLEIFPVVLNLSHFIHYVLALTVLFFFMLLFGMKITFTVLLLPVIFLFSFIFSLGLVLFISALSVRYKDFQHVVPNLLTLWFFLTPIIYPLNQIPEKLRFLVYLNPLAVIMISYQKVLYYFQIPTFFELILLIIFSILSFILGDTVYSNLKETFVEEI